MTSSQTPQQRRARFFELHARPEVFVMPNPWDIGSAKMLAHAGFEALATTSAGYAWSLGVDDGDVSFDQLFDHVRAIASAVDVPLNVDSERLLRRRSRGRRRQRPLARTRPAPQDVRSRTGTAPRR